MLQERKFRLAGILAEAEYPCGMELAVHRLLPASVAAMWIVVPVIALFFFLQIGAARARQAAPTSNAANNEYVGSQACAECHRAIYSVFSETDMGRSMSTVSPELLGRFPKSAQVLDTKLNRRFEISVRDGSLFQTDYEIGPDGKDIFRDTQKVEWIIGAGANGFSAIVRRGDVLFEAPLSFYSSTQKWGLSPGYESYDYGFSRPILPACIVCHSGRPRPIPDGNGRFREPPFQELAVGCENCHGPGATHSRRMKENTAPAKNGDLSIVNPAKLPSWLADNVCASCHQTGDARVLKPGKNFPDFRPGSALDDTVALLMVPPKRDAPPQSDLLEHYFSMTLSKCYRASGRRLSCITCHDPHTQPAGKTVPDVFRSRCLTCHTEKRCAVPLAIRQHKTPPDDCAGCHMPKRDVKEISHSVLTNHRIIRESGEPYPEAAFHLATSQLPDLIHIDAIPGQTNAPLPSVTLLHAYAQLKDSHPEYESRYLTLAERLQTSDTKDVSVLEALAYAALKKKNGEAAAEAIDYLQRAIAENSISPADFELCGTLLMRVGRLPQAAELLQRGIKAIPHDGELYRLLGATYLAQNKPSEASNLLTHASQIFPENTAIRALLSESLKATVKQ